MGLAQIRVRDFQSIKSATIPIGRLTVVVGESNVGKSALVRALHLLARNGSSTGLVRKGADHLTVAAVFQGSDDDTAIQIRRGPRLSEYKVASSGNVETYTKCGTGVPPDITKYWSLASTDLGELSFHGQHDAPFLLSQPASSVARQVSAITNAHLLNDAVRETNRRRLEASQEARSFSREADECRAQLAGVGDLKARKEALQRVRTAVEAATTQSELVAAVQAVVQRAAALQGEIAELERTVGPSARMGKLVEVADSEVGRWQTVRVSIRRAAELMQEIKHEDAAAAEWSKGAEQIESDAHRMLVEAGSCPACGQKVAA